MAAISVTAANVDAGTDGEIGHGVAGVAFTAGQPIYYDRTAGTYKLGDADTEAEAKCAGIAVCDAAAGQSVTSSVGTHIQYLTADDNGDVICLNIWCFLQNTTKILSPI